MPADKRFFERLNRIQTGKTWVPDGVVHNHVGPVGATPARQGMRAGLRLVLLMALPVAFAVTQPDYVPEPILAFLTAPDTETAMASLGQIPFAGGF